MTTRAIERVDQWETRSFAGGYRGLQELVERDFSGVVRSPAGTLCMLNGTVVGIVDGTIEGFENADGTAYKSPTPALPLLIVMQDRADEVRAKYYTEETPLSKVDSTLSDGGFTGYIELSENVLSGDYYVVYHGGRSMSVAFVGNSGQLLNEEEAFERADGEVGIYEVRDVDIDPIGIPEPDGAATGASDHETDDGEGDRTTTAAVGEATAASAADSTEESAESASVERPESEMDSGETGGTAASPPEDAGKMASTEDDPAETDGDTDPGTTAGSAATDDSSQETVERTAPSESDGSDGDEAAMQDRETVETSEEDVARTVETTSGRETELAAETTDRTIERERQSTPETGERSTENGASEGVPPGEQNIGSAETEREPTAGRHPEGSREDHSTASGSVGSETGNAVDLEMRTIPSLDPDRTWTESADTATAGPTTAAPTPAASSPEPSDEPETRNAVAESSVGSTGTESSEDTSTGGNVSQNDRSGGNAKGERNGGTDDRVRELEETIAEREGRIEDLEAQLSSVREERGEIATERDELAAERDELRAERDELRTELEAVREELAGIREQRDELQTRLEEADTAAQAAETRLSRGEAMDGTDLFVRYDSKGEPTLKTAHDSGASRSDVIENLNVEYHTQFETDGAVVSGQPFDAFLRDTIEYRFVSWLLRQLPFEIRDTGHQNALSDLYDALPLIDRAELNGEATVEYTEEGQTKRSQETFDVVLRDRMGNPLVVTNFNDTREAAAEDDMRSLVTSATRVGESHDTLAGAMYVTASFFEPGALETAAESTGGGLLSRDKRESFVKVSRKQGYHLCLVEARDEQFHMAVPEL